IEHWRRPQTTARGPGDKHIRTFHHGFLLFLLKYFSLLSNFGFVADSSLVGDLHQNIAVCMLDFSPTAAAVPDRESRYRPPRLFLQKTVVLYFNCDRQPFSIGEEFRPVDIAAGDQ